MQPHFGDLDAERGSPVGDIFLDFRDRPLALDRQQGKQLHLSQLAAQRGADHLRQLGIGLLERAHRLIEAQRIADAEVRVGFHLDAFLVAQYDLLGGWQQCLQASVVKHQRIDEWNLELEPRLIDHPAGGAEADEQRQFGFAEHVKRRADDIQADENRPGGKPAQVQLHGVASFGAAAFGAPTLLAFPSLSDSGIYGTTPLMPLPEESMITLEAFLSTSSMLSK